MGVPLYDALLRGKVYAPVEPTPSLAEYGWHPVRDALPDAVVVDVTNVCAFVHEGTSKGTFDAEDFPGLVPPFEKLWLETRAPAFCLTPGERFTWNTKDFGAAWGALLWTVDLNSLADDARADTLDAVLGTLHGSDYRVDHVGPVRWVIRGMMFVRYGGERYPTGPMLESWALVDERGMIVRDGQSRDPLTWQLIPGMTTMDDPFSQHVYGNYQAWLFPLFLSISFMNCRNVERVERLPSRHEIREAKRRDLPAPAKFYTLQIDPMQKTLGTEGGIAHNGLKKALHICRGHFSHYTEDKPLFGKYAGQFWIPAHVRGTADAGIVAKDYRILAPEEQTA